MAVARGSLCRNRRARDSGRKSGRLKGSRAISPRTRPPRSPAFLDGGRLWPPRPAALVLRTLLVPLGLGAEHVRRAFGQTGEIDLDRGEGLRPLVAQDADVELAAVDVLLDQRRVLDLVVRAGHALHQVLHVVDQ